MKIINEAKHPQKKIIGKKAPNPTNFSNLRSHPYLTYENSNVLEKADKLASNLSKLGLTNTFLNNTTEESILEINVPMRFPQTAKATGIKKGFGNVNIGPICGLVTAKLQPKMLPPGNESIMDISMSTNGRESIENQIVVNQFQHTMNAFSNSKRETKPLANIMNLCIEDTKNLKKREKLKILNNEKIIVINILTVVNAK